MRGKIGAMADVVAPKLFIWMTTGMLRDNRKTLRMFVEGK